MNLDSGICYCFFTSPNTSLAMFSTYKWGHIKSPNGFLVKTVSETVWRCNSSPVLFHSSSPTHPETQKTSWAVNRGWIMLILMQQTRAMWHAHMKHSNVQTNATLGLTQQHRYGFAVQSYGCQDPKIHHLRWWRSDKNLAPRCSCRLHSGLIFQAYPVLYASKAWHRRLFH